MSISKKFIMLEKLLENMSNETGQNGFTPQWHLDEVKKRVLNIEPIEVGSSEKENAISYSVEEAKIKLGYK